MSRPRSIFLTGASSGIGRALALEYAKGGAKVALTARRRDLLDEVADGVKRAGGVPWVRVLDVRDPSDVRAAVNEAADAFGGLGMAIANAGIGVDGGAADIAWDDLDDVIAVNVRGAMATLHAAIPRLLPGGHLVAITSLAGRRGLPENGAYGASKAAMSAFCDTLRLDLAKSKIRVTDVRPGFVDTPIIRRHAYDVPLVVPVDEAAALIAKRLESGPASISFPFPLVALTELARVLPAFLYDPLILAIRGQQSKPAKR